MIIGVVAAVIVVAALVIAIVVNSGSSDGSTTTIPPGDAASVVATVTGISHAELASEPAAQGVTTPVSGTPIAVDGKPEVLYIGAEYCPFCAAERWPLLVALAQFGTFTDVGVSRSSSTDIHPDTATVTFHGSTFTSPYLAFTPVEVATNQPDGAGGYTRLDTPTPQQQQVVAELSPNGSIPFIDFGGHALISGASYDPGILQGQTAAQIAEALADPNSTIAKTVLPVANAMVATICQLTGNQPSTACG